MSVAATRTMSKVTCFLGIANQSFTRLYHARRRWLSIAAVLALAVAYAAIAWGAVGPAAAQESPLPTPEGSMGGGTTVFLPVIMKAFPPQYTPPDNPVVLACGDDACLRGDLYRNLVSNTIVVMNPLAGWASSGCTCGLMDAQARGSAIGTIIAMGVKIVGRIFATIGTVIGQALNLLLQFWELATAASDEYSVSCESDMELFCFGLAAIVALDDIGGGIIMTLTLLLVSVASIYLILWVVQQVREVMQPGGGDD